MEKMGTPPLYGEPLITRGISLPAEWWEMLVEVGNGKPVNRQIREYIKAGLIKDKMLKK